MWGIKELLERYKHIQPPDASIRRAVYDALCNKGIVVQEKNIRVVGGVVYVETDNGTKNKIFMQKTSILKTVKETLGRELVRDIR